MCFMQMYEFFPKLSLNAPYDFIDVRNAMTGTVIFHIVYDFHRDGGVNEVSSPNLYGGGSREHEFNSVTSVHYATKTNHRNFYGFGYLPYHTDGYRADCRAGKASGNR